MAIQVTHKNKVNCGNCKGHGHVIARDENGLPLKEPWDWGKDMEAYPTIDCVSDLPIADYSSKGRKLFINSEKAVYVSTGFEWLICQHFDKNHDEYLTEECHFCNGVGHLGTVDEYLKAQDDLRAFGNRDDVGIF